MTTVSRQAERLAREKLRRERLKNPAMLPGQLNITRAQDLAFNRRISLGKFGLLRDPDVEEIEEPIPSVDELPPRMVNFVRLKKCSCGALNEYGLTDCKKCKGHFCYDKT